MQATPTASRFSLRGGVPRPVRRVATWACLLAYPFVVVAAVRTGVHDPSWFPLLRYLLPLLVVALPGVLLRRLPAVALGLMLLGAALITGTMQSSEEGYFRDVRDMQFITIDVAVGCIAARSPVRRSVWAAGAALAVQVAVIDLNPLRGRAMESAVMLALLMLVTGWMAGTLIRQRSVHAVALAEQAADQAAVQAVTAERLRIARELHDMVAHSISVIAIQAGVGSRVMHSQPAEARRALDAIEMTSRDTLAGLRRALGALRSGALESGPDAAPLDPAPGLRDVERLADSVRGAGMHLEVWWLGNRRPIQPDIDLSAFRIIQEAVTNVVRHAGTRTCQITIDYGDDELALEVCDDGTESAKPGAGYGLVGMRERVGLLGGSLEAGPRPGGGFRVAARLPLPADAR